MDFLDALSMLENGIVPRYKRDGRGEIVQDHGRKEPEAELRRAPTFADAFGERMLN